jgi:hypothetical protein
MNHFQRHFGPKTSGFLIAFIVLMSAVAISSAQAEDAGVVSSQRLACRFTAAPIDPACLNRSGTLQIEAQRVFSANGVDFPTNIKVYEISLKGLSGTGFAITRRGAYVDYGSSTFELFQGDTRLRPARWPDAGFSRDMKLAEDKKGIVLPPELYQRFAKEPDLWIGAYWTTDWAFETSRVKAMVPSENKLMFDPLKAPQAIRANFPFYVFNALSALTHPGDYVLDDAKQTVYAAAVNDSNTFEVGIEQNLLEIDGARNLTLKGLRLDKVLGTALVIRNSENITIDGCDIRHSGGRAILVDGGKNVVISNCRIGDIAETAIEIGGGDRATLTPSGHVVKNSIIRDFDVDARGYHPGIMISGVGVLVEENTLEDSPHSAIMIKGNEHVIRRNKISNVVTEADDAGAIYAGRDWTERGNLIEGNLITNVGMPASPVASQLERPRVVVSGVYLDDQESGFRIIGNIFDRVSRPVFINGGRDNVIENNAFLRCRYSAIWMSWRRDLTNFTTLSNRLDAVPYQNELWSRKYPELARIKENSPNSPLNNEESHNTAANCAFFIFHQHDSPDIWFDKGKIATIWESIGRQSNVVSTKMPEAPTKQLLDSLGMSCQQYPVLCQ